MPSSKMKNYLMNKDFFCSSPASTAICSSIDGRTMARNSLKPLNNHTDSNPKSHYKTFNNNNIYGFSSPSSRIPCISELPFTPRPQNRLKTERLGSTPRRKSSADITDLRRELYKSRYSCSPAPVGHSSRHLLDDDDKYEGLVTGGAGSRSPEKELRKCRSEKGSHWSLIDTSKDDKKVMSLGFVKVINNNNNDDNKKVIKEDNYGKNGNYNGGKNSKNGDYGQKKNIMGQCNDPTRDYGAKDNNQVVVLRVSLNCKCRGCEAKLRKHLSKMQGVTSFSIDLEVKKVTVVGNISPLEVLTSISKIKNAQFWPSSASSSSSTTSSSSTSSTSDLSY